MNTIRTFHRGVYNQARISGHDESTAAKVAALATLSRMKYVGEGIAVAQESDFTNCTTKLYSFDIKTIRVDQAGEKGVIVDAILASPEPDMHNQAFSTKALEGFAHQINTQGIGGYTDEHKKFRETKERNMTESVTEWVTARVENGRLWITAKMKTGYEWVVDKFRALSLEALFPVDQALIQGKKTTFMGGGVLKGFVFTNKPKQPMNRITNVRAA
jgi:hypothetical protein